MGVGGGGGGEGRGGGGEGDGEGGSLGIGGLGGPGPGRFAKHRALLMRALMPLETVVTLPVCSWQRWRSMALSSKASQLGSPVQSSEHCAYVALSGWLVCGPLVLPPEEARRQEPSPSFS